MMVSCSLVWLFSSYQMTMTCVTKVACFRSRSCCCCLCGFHCNKKRRISFLSDLPWRVQYASLSSCHSWRLRLQHTLLCFHYGTSQRRRLEIFNPCRCRYNVFIAVIITATCRIGQEQKGHDDTCFVCSSFYKA